VYDVLPCHRGETVLSRFLIVITDPGIPSPHLLRRYNKTYSHDTQIRINTYSHDAQIYYIILKAGWVFEKFIVCNRCDLLKLKLSLTNNKFNFFTDELLILTLWYHWHRNLNGTNCPPVLLPYSAFSALLPYFAFSALAPYSGGQHSQIGRPIMAYCHAIWCSIWT